MHGWVWFSLSCGQVRLKLTSTGLGRLRGRSITLRGPPNSVLHSFRTSMPCLDLIFLKAVRCPWLLRLQYPSFSTGISDPADFSVILFTSLHHCLLLRLYLFLASANLSMFSWVLFSFTVLNRWRFLAEGGSGAMIKRTAGVWEATSPQRIGPVSSDGTWWLRTSV